MENITKITLVFLIIMLITQTNSKLKENFPNPSESSQCSDSETQPTDAPIDLSSLVGPNESYHGKYNVKFDIGSGRNVIGTKTKTRFPGTAVAQKKLMCGRPGFKGDDNDIKYIYLDERLGETMNRPYNVNAKFRDLTSSNQANLYNVNQDITDKQPGYKTQQEDVLDRYVPILLPNVIKKADNTYELGDPTQIYLRYKNKKIDITDKSGKDRCNKADSQYSNSSECNKHAGYCSFINCGDRNNEDLCN